jgi:hypothetical protein
VTQLVPDHVSRFCESCHWWGGERAHLTDGSVQGTCRVKPPKPVRLITLLPTDKGKPKLPTHGMQGMWPWTAFDDWCGAYAAKGSIV